MLIKTFWFNKFNQSYTVTVLPILIATNDGKCLIFLENNRTLRMSFVNIYVSLRQTIG